MLELSLKWSNHVLQLVTVSSTMCTLLNLILITVFSLMFLLTVLLLSFFKCFTHICYFTFGVVNETICTNLMISLLS